MELPVPQARLLQEAAAEANRTLGRRSEDQRQRRAALIRVGGR